MTMKIITFKIDEELLEKIDVVAQETNTTRSEVIRKAIIMYLSKVEKETATKRPRIRIIED